MATKPPTKLTKAEQKRQRIEAAKAAAARAQRRERNIRLGLIAGAVAAVIAIIVIAVVVFGGSKTRSKTSPHAAIPTTPATSAAGRLDAPPWAAPADASAAVASAGLPMLGEEGNALHFHGHLDVIVDG